MIYASAAGGMYVLARRRNDLCERRGTNVLALKHAAPRLRGLRLGLQTRAGHASRRRTRETMFVFAAVCLARICLRLQPLESSLGRVPQAADGACE